MALGRLPDVDGQRPGEDDEDLLLSQVAMPSSLRSRRVAPDVRAGLLQSVGQRRTGTRVVLPPGLEVELIRVEDRVAHQVTLAKTLLEADAALVLDIGPVTGNGPKAR